MNKAIEELEGLDGLALDICRRSMTAQLTPSEIKLATWLVAAAHRLGGFPVEFSMREIKEGCMRGPIHLEGWSAHYRTIGGAIEGLQDKSLMSVTDGTRRRFGHLNKVFVPIYPPHISG
jgi:hypothetical protein